MWESKEKACGIVGADDCADARVRNIKAIGIGGCYRVNLFLCNIGCLWDVVFDRWVDEGGVE